LAENPFAFLPVHKAAIAAQLKGPLQAASPEAFHRLIHNVKHCFNDSILPYQQKIASPSLTSVLIFNY